MTWAGFCAAFPVVGHLFQNDSQVVSDRCVLVSTQIYKTQRCWAKPRIWTGGRVPLLIFFQILPYIRPGELSKWLKSRDSTVNIVPCIIIIITIIVIIVWYNIWLKQQPQFSTATTTCHLSPFFQVHLGEPVLSRRRDLLEQPMNFYEPDVFPATQPIVSKHYLKTQ